MKDKQPTLSMRLTPRTETTRPTLQMRLRALLPLVLLCAGLSLWTGSAFPSLRVSWVWLCIPMVLLGAGLLLCCGTRAEKFVYAAAVLVCVLSFVLYRASFVLPINDYFSALQRVSGHIFLHFEENGRIWPIIVSVLCAGAVLMSRAAYSRSLFWTLPILIPMTEGAVSDVVPFRFGMALFLCAAVLLPFRRGASVRASLGRIAAVAVSVLLAVCIALPLRSLPASGVTPALREAAHGILYDSRTNAMPEGRLSRLKGFRRNDAAALQVTLEKPQALYLRGAIYETYTGRDWKALDASTRAAYANLFYYLHDAQYYGQTQVASALRESGVTGAMKMQVRTLSACRAHGYLPYGAFGVAADETLIGDAEIPKQTDFYCYADDSETLNEAQRTLAAHTDAHAAYLQTEQAYYEYAQKVDLSLTSDARAVLDRQFRRVLPASRTLTDVQTAIRTFLDETLTYDEMASAAPKKADFLSSLLEESRCGYSVHYATAAVLMLRYCGVPARYAEGYYLPQGGAGEITVTEQHAHAWAEMYLDGVGFVPFEVTPGYASDALPKQDGEKKLDRAGQTPASDPISSPPQAVQPQEEEKSPRVVSMLGWLLLLLLPLAAFVLWIVLRRRKLRKALERIDASPAREAVLLRYGYTRTLRRYCPRPMPDSEDVTTLIGLAQFSDHTITETQVRQMDDFAEAVRQDCLRQWNAPRRLYYRFLRCILL